MQCSIKGSKRKEQRMTRALEWRELLQLNFKRQIVENTERQKYDVRQFLFTSWFTDISIYSTGPLVFAANVWELLRGSTVCCCPQEKESGGDPVLSLLVGWWEGERSECWLASSTSERINGQHDQTAQVEINHVVGTWREKRGNGWEKKSTLPHLARNSTSSFRLFKNDRINKFIFLFTSLTAGRQMFPTSM